MITRSEYNRAYYDKCPKKYEEHKARVRRLDRERLERWKASPDKTIKEHESLLDLSPRKCKTCGKEKVVSEFGTTVSLGIRYRARICRCCKREYYKKLRERRTPAQVEHHRQLHKMYAEKIRADRALSILRNCSQSDKKRGFSDHDLTLEAIRELISTGCNYCGCTSSKMTLDRIDNALGHSLANVVAACLRCNYMRRDMPYEAWKILAPAVRQAREAGLFGDWIGAPSERERSSEVNSQ